MLVNGGYYELHANYVEPMLSAWVRYLVEPLLAERCGISHGVTSVDDTVCKVSIYCRKVGNIVFINGTATPQKDLTAQTDVGILPEGFYNNDGNWIGVRASSTSGATNYYCKLVNNKIYLHGNVDTIKNGTPILITGTYIVG